MFKTILAHVDTAPGAAVRIGAAPQRALHNDGHLVGSAMTGLSAFALPITAMEAGMPPIALPIAELRACADHALDQFEAAARAIGADKVERRRPEEEAGPGLCPPARYADLIVIGQPAANPASPSGPPTITASVLLNCARPVLVLPTVGAPDHFGRNGALALNGSAQAARAITSAIPILQRASRVNLVVVLDNDAPRLHGEGTGADMALYLARHGVNIVACVIDRKDDEGLSLLSFAVGQRSDLLVRGAVGHSRLHEACLGGATRTALQSSSLPLWMAH
jgi:nucleotide-binding universal stress UspA family protein